MIRQAEMGDLMHVSEMALNFAKSLKMPFEVSEYDIMITTKAMIESDDAAVFVDEHGMIGGTLEPIYFKRDRMKVQELAWWVEPEHRKNGLGDDLRTALEDWARERGATMMSMFTIGSGGDESLKANEYFKSESVYWRLI